MYVVLVRYKGHSGYRIDASKTRFLDSNFQSSVSKFYAINS